MSLLEHYVENKVVAEICSQYTNNITTRKRLIDIYLKKQQQQLQDGHRTVISLLDTKEQIQNQIKKV